MGGTSLFRVGDEVELWRVLLHLSVLVVCLMLFERALHHLEARAAVSAKFQQLLNKAYREIMILGLIGLGLKLVKEAPSVDGGSASMTAFQVADLTIFILALALILQTVCIFLVLRKHNVQADRAELLSTEDLADTVASTGTRQMGGTQELIHLRLLRHLFISRFELPQLFPFAKYLRQAQNNQITHMTDVGAPMWAVLLAVAWCLEGITTALSSGESDLTRRRSLVFVLVVFSWALLALHVVVLVYFRSCVQQLLRAAGLSADQTALKRHLRSIALGEARAWTQEDAGKALLVMQKVQEQHEQPRPQTLQPYSSEKKTDLEQDLTPQIEIPWFSRKSWHFTVMLLLMLNGFYLALVVQCVAYQVSIVYADLGLVEVLAIPLPLLLNTLLLQPRIFRSFVLVSSIFRVDGITLGEVVGHFREIVELRSEFAVLLCEGMRANKISISDLQAALESHDPSSSGVIGVENMRMVLRVCGLRLSCFRFNSVSRLLFELKDMRVEYSQLLNLVALAQREELVDSTYPYETMMVHHHPLLLQSVLSEEDEEKDQVIIRGNSYSPPTLAALNENGTAVKSVGIPNNDKLLATRPQFKRNDSKFQGMGSSTLHGLFHIESALDLGAANPLSDESFAHV